MKSRLTFEEFFQVSRTRNIRWKITISEARLKYLMKRYPYFERVGEYLHRVSV